MHYSMRQQAPKYMIAGLAAATTVPPLSLPQVSAAIVRAGALAATKNQSHRPPSGSAAETLAAPPPIACHAVASGIGIAPKVARAASALSSAKTARVKSVVAVRGKN